MVTELKYTLKQENNRSSSPILWIYQIYAISFMGVLLPSTTVTGYRSVTIVSNSYVIGTTQHHQYGVLHSIEHYVEPLVDYSRELNAHRHLIKTKACLPQKYMHTMYRTLHNQIERYVDKDVRGTS